MTEFEKYAIRGRGISSLSLHRFNSLYASYMNPMIIEERQLNVAQMDVFSRLMMDRIIFLGCPINDDVANIIQAQLLFLESSDPKADIMLYINSPGGVVYSGLGIYDTMQTIQPDVATICTGMAASMASILLAAGAKGKRYALPNAEIMIHQPSGGARGQATEIQIVAENILRTRERLNRILAENTGKPIEVIAQDTERDNFMTAQEALEYGLIDKVLDKRD